MHYQARHIMRIKSVLLIAILSLLTATTAFAEQKADADFEALAARYLDEMPSLSPVSATSIGDHRYDDILDQVNASARKKSKAFYRRYQRELDHIDSDQLSRPNQVDAELLRNEVQYNLWSINKSQEWAWNPLYYNSLAGNGVYGLLARDFAPLEERLDNAASRLEQYGRFFRQARASMDPSRVPKINAETAIKQNRGLLSIIDTMITPELANVSPTVRAHLEKAIAEAKPAIEKHQAWLENDLLPKASGDFRIGAELFDEKLALALNSSLTRKEIRQRAEDEYVRVREEMYELSKGIYKKRYPYTYLPDHPDEALKQAIIRSTLELAYEDRPERGAIVATAEKFLAQATEFVKEKNIVAVPAEPVEIIVMPEFQRGVAVAYLSSPGPLDKGQKSFYSVAPLPEEWTDEQAKSFLREYNNLSIQDLTIHEAMPGHYLQLALSNRYPSTLRSVLRSGPFIEGWAVYAERVMVDEGYLEDQPLMRLIMLKWYLRAVTNAIIDQAIHVDNMSEEDAMRLMIEGGFQEEREAAGKWIRAQLSSTQLSTYFVGYQEHADMRRAVEKSWGDDFTLRRYHDQALSYGSPPVRYVRALMLNEPIPRAPK